MLKFLFDRRNDSRPYPNLAPWQHNPHESYSGLGDTYPWITPCRLLLYAQDHGYPIDIYYTDQAWPEDAWYPVGLGWFDFSLNYFELMSAEIRTWLRLGRLRVLFYYHEGDNPAHVKQRLDHLCDQHQLPRNCYVFVTGNSACANLDGFVYFADHELFYWRNSVIWNQQSMPGCAYHTRPRTRRFTALNRFHKWWRATIMADLVQHRPLLDRTSYWSYNNIDMGDQYHDNPIELHAIPGLEDAMKLFLQRAPYSCDQLTTKQHNQHWTLVPDHFDNSYVHIVFETFFDADSSGGCFISEKIFKPIRHAQPFVVFGTAGTLQTLRDLGYRTFDHVINNSYDSTENNTQRYMALRAELDRLNGLDLHQLYMACRDDILHNQQLFLASKIDRLAGLAKNLYSI
jgi:hypothetical protein